MPIETLPPPSSSFYLICFDRAGNERKDGDANPHNLMSASILADAGAKPPTHVFLFSHGWKGDVPEARQFYRRWFAAMLAQADDIRALGAGFQPMWIGIHWPSLPFGDEELSGESFGSLALSQSDIMEGYVNFFDQNGGVSESLQAIFDENTRNAGAVQMPAPVAESYRKLANAIGYASNGINAAPDRDGVPFDPVASFEATEDIAASFAESAIMSGLLSPLRQLSFWTMKKRARTIGEQGLHPFVAKLQEVLPNASFHLVGHSFGCIVASAVLGGPNAEHKLPRPVNSLVLVQGAVSHWAYADEIREVSKPGYFNSVIRHAIDGPIVATRSQKDRAVGLLYPLAVGLVGQVSFAGEPPLFGGIGTWGIQGLAAAEELPMMPQDGHYAFKAGSIYNLEASKYVLGHSSIDGAEVAHAIWQTLT